MNINPSMPWLVERIGALFIECGPSTFRNSRGKDLLLMSFSEETMTVASSSVMSRRGFARRGLAALAAIAGGSATISASAQEVVDEGPESRPTGADPVAAAPVRSGQFIANFALQFVGYPYVWGGNSPAGFDCSGFTQYVILHTVGLNIGHASGGQMNYGTWVDAGNLQPGDLVFFAGTYGAGISHTGVYIGDGQFAHAENPGTGVTISWLWSDYYGAHYAGAMRHW